MGCLKAYFQRLRKYYQQEIQAYLRTDNTFLNKRKFFVKICLQFTYILSCFHKQLEIPYQVESRIRCFDCSWLLLENGIIECSGGKNEEENSCLFGELNRRPSPKQLVVITTVLSMLMKTYMYNDTTQNWKFISKELFIWRRSETFILQNFGNVSPVLKFSNLSTYKADVQNHISCSLHVHCCIYV
jgi:hypothetical protein